MKKCIKLLIVIMLVLSLYLTIFANPPTIPDDYTPIYNWGLVSVEGTAYNKNWSAHWDYTDSPVIGTAHVLLYEFDSWFDTSPYSSFKTAIAAGLNSWSGVGGITVREKAAGETTDLYITTYMQDIENAGGGHANISAGSNDGYTTTVNGNNHLTCLSIAFNQRYMDGVAENEPHGHWNTNQTKGGGAHEMGHVFGLADSFYLGTDPGPNVTDEFPNNSLYRVMRPVTFGSSGRQEYEPRTLEKAGAALIVTDSSGHTTHNYDYTVIDSHVDDEHYHANVCDCGIYETDSLHEGTFSGWSLGNSQYGSYHYKTCTVSACGVMDYLGDHEFSSTKTWYDYGYHRRLCNGCQLAYISEAHTVPYWIDYDGTHHFNTCSLCSGTAKQTHNWGAWSAYSSEYHISYCGSCGRCKIETHNMSWGTCTDCGYPPYDPPDPPK